MLASNQLSWGLKPLLDADAEMGTMPNNVKCLELNCGKSVRLHMQIEGIVVGTGDHAPACAWI